MKKYSYFVPAILLMQQAAAQSYSTPFIQKKAPCGKYHFFTDSSLLLQQKWKEYLQWQNDLKSLHDSVNYRHRNDMPFAGYRCVPITGRSSAHHTARFRFSNRHAGAKTTNDYNTS